MTFASQDKKKKILMGSSQMKFVLGGVGGMGGRGGEQLPVFLYKLTSIEREIK